VYEGSDKGAKERIFVITAKHHWTFLVYGGSGKVAKRGMFVTTVNVP
jgi:hypothetical protein